MRGRDQALKAGSNEHPLIGRFNSEVKNSLKYRTPAPVLWMWAVLFACASLHGQENCDVEAKLLLSPEQSQTAVAALNAKKETTGHVYFYDTSALDLLSHGVIVRLRQGADNDLTVKLRPTSGQKFSDPSAGREDYKCEVDSDRERCDQLLLDPESVHRGRYRRREVKFWGRSAQGKGNSWSSRKSRLIGPV